MGRICETLVFFQAPQPQPHEEIRHSPGHFLRGHYTSRWGKFGGFFDKILETRTNSPKPAANPVFVSCEKRIQNDINLSLMGMMMKMTIRMMTIRYFTLLYFTNLYYTILYLYFPILYFTILYFTILYFTILYYTILFYSILY